MNHDHLILAIALVLGLIALALGYVIREARHAAYADEDAAYAALRDEGMGDLGDTPIFAQLCIERLDAELEADR